MASIAATYDGFVLSSLSVSASEGRGLQMKQCSGE